MIDCTRRCAATAPFWRRPLLRSETARLPRSRPPLATRRPSPTTRQDRAIARSGRDIGGLAACPPAPTPPSTPVPHRHSAVALRAGRNRSNSSQGCRRGRCPLSPSPNKPRRSQTPTTENPSTGDTIHWRCTHLRTLVLAMRNAHTLPLLHLAALFLLSSDALATGDSLRLDLALHPLGTPGPVTGTCVPDRPPAGHGTDPPVAQLASGIESW